MRTFMLPCGRTFEIDDLDAPKLEGRHWFSEKRGRTFYVRGRVSGDRSNGVYLHNFLLGGRSDHKDGNGLNNKRENIRRCTQHQNCFNKAPKIGKRYKGVFYDKRRDHYYAQVVLNRKAYTSPKFARAEDAAHWHDAKATELHGEFAWLNFPPTEPCEDARQGELFAA